MPCPIRTAGCLALLTALGACSSASPDEGSNETAGSTEAGGTTVGTSGDPSNGGTAGGYTETAGTAGVAGMTGKGGTGGSGGSLASGGSGGVKAAGGAAGSGSGMGGGAGTGVVVVPATCDKPNTTLPAGAPALTVGTWKNISPPGVPFDANASAVTQGMTRDPCNAGTVYVCVRFGQSGIYKTTDGGAHWAKAGTLDGCINVRVDPANSQHLYSGDGVGSASDGFWVSNDGGNSWTMPEGFKTAANTVKDYDVYHVEPDPSDFNHVLVTFHYYWQGGNWTGSLAGVFESFDGGNKWTIHQPNPGWDGAGGYDVYFLYNPKLGIGDNKTWLYGTQGKGHWRTTNSGETWTKVTDVSMEHGGGQLYYTQQGVLYASGSGHIIRSKDNGVTWTEIGNNNGFLSVIGDGTNLYTGGHGGGHFFTAKESADMTWTDFNSQSFFEGPFEMDYDPVNSILYSGNIRGGVWALKVK